MSVWQYIIGAVIILVCVGLVFLVLMQESRSAGLSGAIAGGADTFFGKGKSKSREKTFEKLTKILAVAFFVLTLGATVLFMFMF